MSYLLIAELMAAEPTPPLAPVQYSKNRTVSTACAVVAWERLAETCNQYLRKGSTVYLEGRMVSRKYTDKQNIERTVWDCVLSQMEMLDTKDAKDASGSEGAGAASGKGDEWGDVTPDDIPF